MFQTIAYLILEDSTSAMSLEFYNNPRDEKLLFMELQAAELQLGSAEAEAPAPRLV